MMRLLTIDQTRCVLRCRRGEVIDLLDKGEIPFHPRGTARVIADKDLLDYAVRVAQARIDAELSKGPGKRADH